MIINAAFTLLTKIVLHCYLLAQVGICFIYSILSLLPPILEEPNPNPSLGQQVAMQAPRFILFTSLIILPLLHQAFTCPTIARWLLRISAGVNAALSTWALVGFVVDVPFSSPMDIIPIAVLLANPLIFLIAACPALHRRVFPPSVAAAPAPQK